MPCIPVHTVADAPDNGRDEPKALGAKMGKVLNIHGELAHATTARHQLFPIDPLEVR